MDAPSGTISLTDLMDQIEREKGQPKPKDKKLAPARYPARPEGVTKLADLPPATEAEQAERIAPFRRIVERATREAVVWIDGKGKRRSLTVDLFTAGIVCQVFDKLAPENRAKLMVLEPTGVINMALKAAR